MLNESAIGFVGSNMEMGIVDGKETAIVCVLEIGFVIVDHVGSNDLGFEIVGLKMIISFQMLRYLRDDHVLYRL
jgi:hypothetical protein